MKHPIHPKEDPTSLGAILLELRLVTQEQLDETIRLQETMRKDTLLGVLLVHNGLLTQQELDVAISAQESMRTHDQAGHALAIADVAIARHSRQTLVDRRLRIMEKGEMIARSISDHYPTITPEILAKCTGRK